MQEILGQLTSDTQLADLHMHTNRSGGRMKPEMGVDLADRMHQLNPRFNAIAFTDHGSIKGGMEAKEYRCQKGYDIEVIPGVEITTSDGHLLALYLEYEIPSGQSVEWTIDQAHKNGALVIVPHPMHVWTRSLKRQTLIRIIQRTDDVKPDGFGIFNAGVNNALLLSSANQNARDFYLRHSPHLGSAIGSTDGHYYTMGRGLTGYQGNLFDAIKAKQTAVFSLDQFERVENLELAYEMFGSMVLDPVRKVARHLQCAGKEEELAYLRKLKDTFRDIQLD